MFNSDKKNYTKTEYRLMINNRSTKIKVTRLSTAKDHFNTLVRSKEFSDNRGFFKYESEGLSTHLFPENVDLIFVGRGGEILEKYVDLAPNKFTARHEGSKFVYIFPKDTIKSWNIETNDILTHQKWKRKI